MECNWFLTRMMSAWRGSNITLHSRSYLHARANTNTHHPHTTTHKNTHHTCSTHTPFKTTNQTLMHARAHLRQTNKHMYARKQTRKRFYSLTGTNRVAGSHSPWSGISLNDNWGFTEKRLSQVQAVAQQMAASLCVCVILRGLHVGQPVLSPQQYKQVGNWL